MTRALEHFLPNTELNLHSLREVVHSLASGAVSAADVTASGTLSEISDQTNDGSGKSARGLRATSQVGSSPSNDTCVTIEEIDELHNELGWLRVDSKGTYRHVGPDSGYGFNAAVRSLKHRRMSTGSKSDLVAPISAAPALPLPTPESTAAMTPTTQVFLPRRDLCNRCVSRFFRDVQSVYWFFSAERFFSLLDRIYAGDSSCATPSMLCSLYSILAMTCESESRPGGPELMDTVHSTATKYLSLAKSLVPVLYDEADVDSVRALCLLGLALQSSMFSNVAYIYIGSAARIAFTLGLNLQKKIESRSCLERQVDLRVFSTLFLLDLDVALCYGNPSAIDEDNMGKLQDLSEQHHQILSPGSNMPLDYLTVSCQLAQIKRHISKLIYSPTVPTTTRNLSISTVSDALASLRGWHASIPHHLREASHAATFHQRSVAVLHLRYWSAAIFATRPFLLYSVLHPTQLAADSPKRAWFEDFSAVCVDAAARSLAVLRYMREAGLLSSLVTLDAGCVLEDLQVFLLAVSLGAERRADDVRGCLGILQGMEQVMWTRHALTEVLAQLEEAGMMNADNGFSPGEQTAGNFFLDIGQQHDFGPGMMESYLPDLQDAFFGLPERATSLLAGAFDEDVLRI